jgi:hypothetical protein
MRNLFVSYSIWPIFFIILITDAACNGRPPDPNFENAGGFVIGKESCNTDTTRDYWLVDLSIFPAGNTYGDSLLLNTYIHVVKTLGLASQFKFVGKKVDFDFRLSSTPVQTSNCSIASPITYLLKEMQVLNQAEIR